MLTCLLLPLLLPPVYSQYNSQRNILFKYKKLKHRSSCAQNPPMTQNGSLSQWTNTVIKNLASGTLLASSSTFLPSQFSLATNGLLTSWAYSQPSNLYISWILCLEWSSSRYQHGWLSHFKSSHKCHLLSEDHHDLKIATFTHHPHFCHITSPNTCNILISGF